MMLLVIFSCVGKLLAVQCLSSWLFFPDKCQSSPITNLENQSTGYYGLLAYPFARQAVRWGPFIVLVNLNWIFFSRLTDHVMAVSSPSFLIISWLLWQIYTYIYWRFNENGATIACIVSIYFITINRTCLIYNLCGSIKIKFSVLIRIGINTVNLIFIDSYRSA